MIVSIATAARAFERAPDPAFGSPSERHDAGWLGQVPPPEPPSASPTAVVDDPAVGYDPTADPHDGCWLGQVPPPKRQVEQPAAIEETAVGFDPSRDAHDGGWLGQVPPPAEPAPTPPAADESPYAVPHLAPEPWKSDPPLPGTDPTLFG